MSWFWDDACLWSYNDLRIESVFGVLYMILTLLSRLTPYPLPDITHRHGHWKDIGAVPQPLPKKVSSGGGSELARGRLSIKY